MKQSKYSDSQIMAILKSAQAGALIPEQCPEPGMSAVIFYQW
jgi:putative transposase